MVYIVLVLAVALGTFGAVVMKFFQRNNRSSMYSVLQFATLSSAVAAVMLFCINGFKLNFGRNSLLIALGMSLQVSLNTPIQIKAFEKGNVAMAVVASMLGSLLLPFLYGIIFLGEAFTVFKSIGLICILATTVFMLPPKGQMKKGSNAVVATLLCLLIFLFNGIFFTLMKVHSSVGTMTESGLMSVTYGFMAVFSAISLAVLYIHKCKRGEREQLQGVSIFAQNKVKNILFFVGYGGINSLSNLCSLITSKSLPASVQFPLVSGGIIIFSAITSFIFFKERITLKTGIMLLFAVASVVLFAL